MLILTGRRAVQLVSGGLSVITFCLVPLMAEEKPSSLPSKLAAVSENTRQIYRDLCSDCHGSDGRGTDYRDSGIAIPDFSSKVWVQSTSSSQLKLAILLGKGEEMPPFENEIPSQEAMELVLLIRRLAGFDENAQDGERPVANGKLRAQLIEFRESWGILSKQWESKFESLTVLRAKRLSKEHFRGDGSERIHQQSRKAD